MHPAPVGAKIYGGVRDAADDGRMGHRARRRLTVGVVALLVAVAAVAGVVLLGGGSGSSGKRPGISYVGPTDARYDANRSSVVFGMTRAQVRKLVGPPTKVVGSCWQYQINEYTSFHGQHSTFNADRLCFLEGKYSDYHSEVNGRWDYQPKIVFTQ